MNKKTFLNKQWLEINKESPLDEQGDVSKYIRKRYSIIKETLLNKQATAAPLQNRQKYKNKQWNVSKLTK